MPLRCWVPGKRNVLSRSQQRQRQQRQQQDNQTDGVCVSCLCAAVDACQQANGGCSELAVCKRTQPGRRECVCGSGYQGDGLVCVGTSPSILVFTLPDSSQLPPPPNFLISSPRLLLLFYFHSTPPPSFLFSVSFSYYCPPVFLPQTVLPSFKLFLPPSLLVSLGCCLQVFHVTFSSAEINPCLEGNAGCHKNAECVHVGPNKVKSAPNPHRSPYALNTIM